MRYFKDTLMEHNEYSLKRTIAFILVLLILLAVAPMIRLMFLYRDIPESHLFLLGELFTALFTILGLTVANKHKALQQSTNRPNPYGAGDIPEEMG